MVVVVWYMDFQRPMQSVPFNTNMSSNPDHIEVYSIQYYVIKFASNLLQVGEFLWFPPPIELTSTV